MREVCFLIEEQMRILKFMSEVTGRTDMTDFAKKMGLTVNQTMDRVKALAEDGLVKKVGSGYAITEKGKIALKAVAPLSPNMKYEFYAAIGQPAGFAAESVKQFYVSALNVPVASLEFHLYRGDFENWFRSAVADPEFAEELANIKKANLKGEELRKAIKKAAELRYSL